MKVIHVIDRLNVGGAEKVFIDITKLLSQRNIETAALTFQSGYPLEKYVDPNVKLYCVDRHNKFSLATMKKTNAICRNYDIVHVHLRHCYSYIRLCQFIFGGKYKVVFHDHSAPKYDKKQIPFFFKSFLKPKVYIGVNEELVSWAEEYLHIPKANTHLLSNIVIPDSSVNYAFPQNKKMMVVSNVRKMKNFEFAIALTEKMGWQLDIYGNAVDKEYYNTIMQLIGDSDRVRIITGKSELQQYYSNYNFAIHTSYSETGPLVLLEYMAYGVPFLAYETGNVVKQVKGDLPNMFMDNFDVDAWQQRIEQLLVEPNVTEKVKSVYQKKFSHEAYVDKCIAIYEKVVC